MTGYSPAGLFCCEPCSGRQTDQGADSEVTIGIGFTAYAGRFFALILL
jgi:hypothetical protein